MRRFAREQSRERPATRLTIEDAEDALVHADQSLVPGTARTALRHPDFRRLYFGAFGSNIGSWMQNAVLGAYAFELTGSATFVGLITFAQLGPLLLLALIGGALADQFDRRRLLIAVAVEQLGFSLVLAWLTTSDDPSRVALVGIVLAIGAGQAVHAPTYSAVLPGLVGQRDLAAAISLNSVQMNASARHRTGHRRRAVRRGRRLVGVRAERAHLPGRHRRPGDHDVPACGRR